MTARRTGFASDSMTRVSRVAPSAPSSREAHSVSARFHRLTDRGWGVQLPSARRYRSRLGLTLARQFVIEQLLFHYREPGAWRSFGQELLADELGIDRTTLKDHLVAIRRQGLIAWRADPRYGCGKSTNYYCLEPYLAVLALSASADEPDTADADALREDGRRWLTAFWNRLPRERWTWQLGELLAPRDHDYRTVLDVFMDQYGLRPLVRQEPKAA